MLQVLNELIMPFKFSAQRVAYSRCPANLINNTVYGTIPRVNAKVLNQPLNACNGFLNFHKEVIGLIM